MNLHLEVSPDVEARIRTLAQREGMEPSALIEKIVMDYQPRDRTHLARDFGGKTLGEVYGHLFRTVAFEPTDVSSRDEEYLATTGFGETLDQREPS